MPAYVKVSGSWRTVKSCFVKVSGSWRTVKQIFAKDGTVWKLVWQNIVISLGSTAIYAFRLYNHSSNPPPFAIRAIIRLQSDGSIEYVSESGGSGTTLIHSRNWADPADGTVNESNYQFRLTRTGGINTVLNYGSLGVWITIPNGGSYDYELRIPAGTSNAQKSIQGTLEIRRTSDNVVLDSIQADLEATVSNIGGF